MTVKGRIANAILTLKEKFGVTKDTLDITLSRQDFASYIGATYETVSRIMNEMSEEKAITVNGKQITVVSEKKLLEYIRH
jgi:CRP-like cAMP-binding protein